jgi:hypothetical protein
MSIAFNAFGIILFVSRSCAVLLSGCIGVGGWVWPSSLSVWYMETAVFALMKRAPSSASTVDDMTARIICKMLRAALLFVGMLSLPAINMCPPHIICFARHQHINNPKGLMMEELNDGLQYARICQSDLRKQAKGLQKTHLRDCLVDLQEKKQKKRTTAIKQKINREESKRMWYVIKQTVKDPQSPSILKVQ